MTLWWWLLGGAGHLAFGYLLWQDQAHLPAWESRNRWRLLAWVLGMLLWLFLARAQSWYTELTTLIRSCQ